ncbi:efflux transporter outer membrane subunit [Bryocella elongata]|uniref:efflux transporter outer membrane subunit n=1 Tax=Bryocella elongata TaxID=863522 RepID=UPI001F173F68|nr:efflux transporter outer membrane subunit [Bryocella elongata]
MALSGFVLVLTLAGCEVGPNYQRPATAVPPTFRGALAPAIDHASLQEPSVADQKWQSVFTDPTLQKLIAEALANNLDLKVAAQRVLEAQAQVGVVRSQQLPTLGAGGSFSALQLPAGLAPSNSDGSKNDFIRGGGFSASAAWNLDFWGLYRRQTEAARAELLQSEWAQRATRATLIQDVATSYFQLRSLDAQLAITQNTIQAREQSLTLTQSLENYGAGSRADTSQAEELLHAARANMPVLRQQIAAQENAISILLGHTPEDVDRGSNIDDQPHPANVPTGLPSDLLERRPDVRQAEAALIAANARIGVAKAQFFPQISLTAMGGAASNQLQGIFSGKNAYWYAAGSLSQPIFEGGRIRSNYKYSQAEQQEMVAQYQKAVLGALRDTSNALTAYQQTQIHREEQARLVSSAAEAVRLARLRYAGGNTSYLEVLTTDTDLYDAQVNLAQASEQQANSLVQLYIALGGGW